MKLNKGDVVILYSDGIPEAWNKKREIYGFDRFEKSLKKNVTKANAKDIYEGILDDVGAFMKDHPQADDITLIVVRRTG